MLQRPHCGATKRKIGKSLAHTDLAAVQTRPHGHAETFHLQPGGGDAQLLSGRVPYRHNAAAAGVPHWPLSADFVLVSG